MQVIKMISSAEMVGEFLKAELDSSRFKEGSLRALKMLGFKSDLVNHPDYENGEENEQRAKVLHLTRGWPDEWLFTGFPKDTEWSLVMISQEELASAYRLKSRPSMSETERSVGMTARNINSGHPVARVDSALIGEMVAAIKDGRSFPPIIMVAKDSNGKRVLLEGHSRSIAYCSVDASYLKEGIRAILGISSDMSGWAYF